jgi:hypothetical protein
LASPQPKAPDKPDNRQRQGKHAPKPLVEASGQDEISRWIA